MKKSWIPTYNPGELTRFTDASGKVLTYLERNGTYFPPFPGLIPRLEALPKLPARDDDILIMAYPKSGTHWTWEIINMLLKGRAEDSGREKIDQFIEMIDGEILATHPSPRILNAHISPSFYPEDFVKRKCKIVYLMRNPKDVYVSFFNHTKNIAAYEYEGEWVDYFELAMQGKTETNLWFDYSDAWDGFFKEHPELPVLTLYYEESVQDLLTTVKKLASFLGVEADESLYKDIAHACSFAQMKSTKIKAYPEELLGVWQEKDYRMYRVSGDWKNWFTVAQNERFNALYKDRMKDSKDYKRWLDE